MLSGFFLLFVLIVGDASLLFSQGGINIRSGLVQEKVRQRGAVYEETITLGNTSDRVKEVKFYQTDYLFDSDGKNLFGEPGQTVRSNAKWIRFSPSRLRIPPKGEAKVQYVVSIPDSESLKGTYWSMIMVEPIGEASPESSLPRKKEEKRVSLTAMWRYGIQIVTHIGNTGQRKVRFFKPALKREQGNVIFQIDIENSGERGLVPELSIELFTEAGGSSGKFKGSKVRLYPGTSARFTANLGNVPAGKYRAMILADNGDENVFGTQVNLSI